jgi:hypothetical protein
MFDTLRIISGETHLWFYEFVYRVQLSWKAKHWVSTKEYLDVRMDEIKRGN